ncbi:MAG: hypothetical protein AAGC68_11945 [Verrucomicrobiota bacterium]
MKNILLSSALVVLFLSISQAGHPEKDAKGFDTIFDGSDLSKVKTEGNWQIQEDGSL